MAAAIAISGVPCEYLNTVTASITGASASTDYILAATRSSGDVVRKPVTTDGAGAATVTFVKQASRAGETWTFALRPASEYNGTTTAAATATATL